MDEPMSLRAINLQPALESMENDREILDAVVEAFIGEVPKLLQQLETALAEGDASAAERGAHTLKGNFRILRLAEQQTCWAEIEKRLQQRGSIDNHLANATQITQSILEGLREYRQESTSQAKITKSSPSQYRENRHCENRHCENRHCENQR